MRQKRDIEELDAICLDDEAGADAARDWCGGQSCDDGVPVRQLTLAQLDAEHASKVEALREWNLRALAANATSLGFSVSLACSDPRMPMLTAGELSALTGLSLAEISRRVYVAEPIVGRMYRRGQRHGSACVVRDDGVLFSSPATAAGVLRVTPQAVRNAMRGCTKKVGGHAFRVANEVEVSRAKEKASTPPEPLESRPAVRRTAKHHARRVA